ncbi:tyrosine-type recombinase/integrase [Virgibacillus litoralis]|uniref:Integrase n=1 Tax=Virgibacillus litoralis TaxID=578221 RepID=A0ABS4HH40_9BACI|nr:integrase [Virgibacillus litoralis]
MGSYQRRGENSFLLVVELGYDGKGIRKKKTRTLQVKDKALLRTKKRLENYIESELYKFQAEVESGEYISPEKRKFSDYISDWRNKFAKNNYAARTLQNYNEKLNNYILPYFGSKRLDQIKPIHVVNFMSEVSQPGAAASKREEPLSGATIYEIDKTLRVVLNKAVEWQLIKKSPMDGLKRPKIKKKEMNYYEMDDVIKFILALYKEPVNWRMFFLTSAIAGMRRGEVLALEWTDYDFEENEILLKKSIPFFENGEPHIKNTKTNEIIRRISMPGWYMEEMGQYKKKWYQEKKDCGDWWKGGSNTFLFHKGFGIPYIPSTVNKTWTNIKKRHGLKNIRLHDLRHTMVTYLLEDGESLLNVQNRAGHSSSKITTDIYGHVSKRASKSTAERFEKFNPKHLVNNSSTSTDFD